jgi:O-antigen ligase
MALYFLFSNDWLTHPVKVAALNRAALRWMEARPSLGLPAVHPNAAGAWLVLTAPFTLALGACAWRERRIGLGLGVIAASGLVATALLFSTSRGEVLALAVGVGVWVLWALSHAAVRIVRAQHASSRPLPAVGMLREAKSIAQHSDPGGRDLLSPRVIFVVALALLVLLAAGAALLYPGGPVALFDAMPGPARAASRLDLARGTLQLIRDVPFTGGGLAAFQGLYPRYVLVIPDFLTASSHNHYLDVALEQGILGFLAFGFVYGASLWIGARCAWRAAPSDLLLWAALTSLLIVLAHGVVDNYVVRRGAPFVFLAPGLVQAMARPAPGEDAQPIPARSRRRRWWTVGAVALVVVLLLFLAAAYRRPLLAAWYADLGAVRMAQIELEGFAPGVRAREVSPEDLAPAEALLRTSLRHNPANRTAHHRLGLIAVARHDHPAVVRHLEAANAAGGGHRGIQKALGYAYVWTGQPDRAVAMLAEIPEAGYEMGVYAWWWGTQDRDDLAARAAEMVERLP